MDSITYRIVPNLLTNQLISLTGHELSTKQKGTPRFPAYKFCMTYAVISCYRCLLLLLSLYSQWCTFIEGKVLTQDVCFDDQFQGNDRNTSNAHLRYVNPKEVFIGPIGDIFEVGHKYHYQQENSTHRGHWEHGCEQTHKTSSQKSQKYPNHHQRYPYHYEIGNGGSRGGCPYGPPGGNGSYPKPPGGGHSGHYGNHGGCGGYLWFI